MIHDLKRQGLSISAIARKLGLDRKTVRKHLDAGVIAPAYGPRAARPRQIEAFEPICTSAFTRFPISPGDGCCARSAAWGIPAATRP